MPAPAVVLGSMSKESIQQVIHRSLARVRYCYEKQLRRNPSLGGRVVVFFGIGADGGISDLKISSSTLGDPEVEKCMLKALAPLRFPKPPDGGTVQVSYPFLFSRPE